jgi:hypothetical protein
MIANFIRSLITAWLPALLLNAWLVLVLPRLVYLLVQVGAPAGGPLLILGRAARPPPGRLLPACLPRV